VAPGLSQAVCRPKGQLYVLGMRGLVAHHLSQRYNKRGMVDNPIHFGTSGRRGIIPENFTFSNLRLAAAGITHFLVARSSRPRVVVGYDMRFLSEKFAETASGAWHPKALTGKTSA